MTITTRWGTAAVLMAVLGSPAVPPARAEEAATIVADMWTHYRTVRSETETVDIVIISNPPAERLTRIQVETRLREGGRGVRPKRAVRRVQYGADHQDKVLIVFLAPAEDAGTAFLAWRHPGADKDEQWLYMPSLQRVRRIAVNSSQTFVGTNLRYEDVRELSGERTVNYTYELLPAEPLDGRPCTVVQATPKPEVSTAYKRRKIWIDKEWQLPVKVEYYDARDTLWKVLHNTQVTQLPNGVYRADLLEMRDLQLQETSVVLITKRAVDQDLPAEVFTTDYLERAVADL